MCGNGDASGESNLAVTRLQSQTSKEKAPAVSRRGFQMETGNAVTHYRSGLLVRRVDIARQAVSVFASCPSSAVPAVGIRMIASCCS